MITRRKAIAACVAAVVAGAALPVLCSATPGDEVPDGMKKMVAERMRLVREMIDSDAIESSKAATNLTMFN